MLAMCEVGVVVVVWTPFMGCFWSDYHQVVPTSLGTDVRSDISQLQAQVCLHFTPFWINPILHTNRKSLLKMMDFSKYYMIPEIEIELE